MRKLPLEDSILRRLLAAAALALLAMGASSSAQAAADPLRIEHEDGAIDFAGRVQAGYRYRFLEDGDEDHSKRRFAMGQARLQITGEYYGWTSFELTLDHRGYDGLPEAKDLYLQLDLAPWMALRMGQFKAPVSRHRLTADAKQLFVQRPRVADDFVPGRDIGAALRLHTPGERLRGSFGAFTGRGANQREDDERGLPLLAGRVVWMPLGRVRGGEGDVERTPDLGVSVALNGAWSHDGGPSPEGGMLRSIDGKRLLWGGDVALKWAGLFLSAEMLFARYQPEMGDEYSAAGYFVQASYYLHALRIEPAVRFDELNPSDRSQDDRERSLTVGVNAFPHGDRRVRGQLNYVHRFPATDDSDRGWTEDELLFELQLAFD